MLSHFPAPLSFGNTVIGGDWKKGGHGFDDDNPLEWLIILVLLFTPDEEGSFAGHAARCVFELPLSHDKVVRWILEGQ